MKHFISDIKNSFYNPSFYKRVKEKSNVEIFKYIGKVSLLSGAYVLITFFIGLLSETKVVSTWSQPQLITAMFMGVFGVTLSAVATVFILYAVYSYIYALVAMILSKVVGHQLTYDSSHKVIVYSMTPGLIIYAVASIFNIDSIGSTIILYIIPLLVFILNNKKTV